MIYRIRTGKHSWRPGPLGRLHLRCLRRFKNTKPIEGTAEACGRGLVKATYYRGWAWSHRQGKPTPWTRCEIKT